ncbi:MAG TPA: hypothetical protein VFF26_08890 [Gallionella sp.]|nr:hypothetical protein [Gallionella sp.]
MTDERGFDRFQRAMSVFAKHYIDPAWKSKKTKGIVLDRPTDSAFSSVFYGYIEISNTLEALKLCETLIGVAPPRSKAVKHDEYFKFLVGAYLQEMYILEQRLSTYATRMSRLYKKPQIMQIIDQFVSKALEGIVNTRGAHVHAQRYSDNELDTLSTLTLISQFDVSYTEHLKEQYWWVQLEWGKKVKTNNSATREIVDHYFDVLYPLMTKDDRVVLPRAGKSSDPRP